MDNKYLSSQEACEYLGIKELGTLYSYIREGKLKAHKLGGDNSKRHWRIKLSDLDAFISGDKSNEISEKASV